MLIGESNRMGTWKSLCFFYLPLPKMQNSIQTWYGQYEEYEPHRGNISKEPVPTTGKQITHELPISVKIIAARISTTGCIMHGKQQKTRSHLIEADHKSVLLSCSTKNNREKGSSCLISWSLIPSKNGSNRKKVPNFWQQKNLWKKNLRKGGTMEAHTPIFPSDFTPRVLL